jgi:hypothetical protein
MTAVGNDMRFLSSHAEAERLCADGTDLLIFSVGDYG